MATTQQQLHTPAYRWDWNGHWDGHGNWSWLEAVASRGNEVGWPQALGGGGGVERERGGERERERGGVLTTERT